MRWLLPFLLLAAPALAQTADPVEGGRLAATWCANCHRISAGGPGPAADAVASFPAIAARPNASAEGVATFIRLPHAGMPDHGLTARQAADIAAFVMAQRPNR
ncbi:c-type cytochrome [Falsiroseomonas oryzae]|uniref:c-type cytochrome n=1 Tax=Falsiroseomonas oryzae TaxID=2766473 RepID=UPI0022EA52A7|nr:c-type cytochrome [Roseomonas sp. MO-31]